MSLFKNNVIQLQKDTYKHPGLHKLPTKLFVENQDVNLLKSKDTSMKLQEGTRKATPSKFPTKVINLSPFPKEGSFEDPSRNFTEPPKGIYNKSKIAFRSSKFTPFPSLSKKIPSGKSKITSLKQKSVKLSNTLPTLAFTTKKPIFKVVNNATQKSLPRPSFKQ
ncbi:coiled-coil domain-containing protein 7-like [Cavia porcellus]|uniref:coiled-coil domain-containing protein 7-like n=1 Tax=Cavia porcellus TaxID=10141 RepID=UPI002FE0A880